MASRPSPAPFGPTPFGWRDSPLLAEALVTLALASAAIRLLPFRRVAALAGSGRLGSGRVRGDPGDIDAVRRAVLAWARRVPWRVVCFQQGLALHLMARRRGIATVLHYGVVQESGGLAAHVWVSVDDAVVIGGEEAPRFTCLARFPAAA